MTRKAISRIMVLFTTVSYILIMGCSDPSPDNESQPVSSPETEVNSTETNSNDTLVGKPVKYEIVREPNGGSGVFDFMYIVCVNADITNEEAKYIFNDIAAKKKTGKKIAIDIWSNKKAFNEELEIYQKEDRIYDEGGDLKAFVKEREKITDKYDKYNIAQYTDNGERISVKYPHE